MKTLALIISMIFIMLCQLQAQTLEEMQYAAYLKAGKSLWERSAELARKEYGVESFQAVMAAYGLLNNTMATKDEDTFDVAVESVVDQLKDIIKKHPQWGEPQAVLSTVYGLKMAYSPMKGIIYGAKSGSLIESAVELQAESPLVQKLYGSYKLYTPSMFGGDTKEAVKAFTKSVLIFEQQTVQGNWLYLDTLVHLAMSHYKINEKEQAIEILEKALNIEPDFSWAQAILNSYQNN